MSVAGLLIMGFGGHARSVADIALACGIARLVFIDEQARDGEHFLGFPVLSRWEQPLPEGWQAFPAAGDNQRRREQCRMIRVTGWPLATLQAPSATLGAGCRIGEGTLIAQHAHVGPMASIGQGCIINTAAVIEHEAEVADYSHVSVHASVAGRSRIGECVFIGAGATVIDGIRVADHVVLGAGGCAVSDLVMKGTYLGVPARIKVLESRV